MSDRVSEQRDFRCSVASEARDEPLAGTASTVRAFLLIEHPGPWGVDALRDARLPGDTGPAVRAAAAETGVRPLLIRRPGRSRPDGHRVFAVCARPHDPWVETTVVDHPAELLRLDLADLRAGRSLGLERHEEPLFCVCTHGRHDACCAERGRPVAAALSTAYPDHTWEISHLGGDRFAANVLIAPDGLYFGRLDTDSVLAVAEARMAGRLELDHLRGRTGSPMAVQAAEIALRRHLGVTALDGVRTLDRHVTGDVSTVTFAVDDQRYAVRVRTLQDGPFTLTCRARRDNPTLAHEVLDIA